MNTQNKVVSSDVISISDRLESVSKHMGIFCKMTTFFAGFTFLALVNMFAYSFVFIDQSRLLFFQASLFYTFNILLLTVAVTAAAQAVSYHYSISVKYKTKPLTNFPRSVAIVYLIALGCVVASSAGFITIIYSMADIYRYNFANESISVCVIAIPLSSVIIICGLFVWAHYEP